MSRMRLWAMASAAALAALACVPAQAQAFHSAGRRLCGRDRGARARPSLGGRLPARRPHAGHRAPGPHAHRRADGKLSPALAGVPKVFAAGQGGLHDVVLDRAFAQNHTIYFCYAEPVGGGARTAVARATGRRRHAAARRRQGDLPAGGPALERQSFRLPHRAGARRQPVPDHGDHFGTIATRRRISATISARSSASGPTARCRPTIRSSARPTPSRKSGATAIATRRASRSIRDERQALGARARPARRRRGQHRREGQELRLAGDRLRHRLQRRQDPREPAQGRHGAAGQVLGALDRALRHGVLHRRPVSGLARQPVRRRAGRAIAGAARARRREGGQGGAPAARLRERIRDVRQGPDGALWLLTDSSSLAGNRFAASAPAKVTVAMGR